MDSVEKILAILALASRILSPASSPVTRECKTPSCVANNQEFSAAILKQMNRSVDPCENFYEFACGNYASAPATSRGVRFSSHFQRLQNEKANQLDETITDLLSSRTEFKPYRIVRTIVDACQDVKANNGRKNGEESLETLEKVVEELGSWPVLLRNWPVRHGNLNNLWNWTETVGTAQRLGFFKISFLFAEVQQNDVDGSLQIQVSPPDLEYSSLLKSSKRYQVLVESYMNFMIRVAQELGAGETRAREDLLKSLTFELELAEGKTEEPSEKLTISQLESRWPRIQWVEFFRHSIPDFETDPETPVELVNPRYVTIFEEVISQTPRRVQANYAVWKVIQESIPYLKSPSLNWLRRAYWHQVNSNLALPPMDCVAVAKHFFPFSIYAALIRNQGDIYTRSSAREFVAKIADKFADVVGAVGWLDEQTRKEAVDKVKFMSRIAGYVDLLGNDVLEKFYEGFEISEDYLRNYQNLNLFIMKNRVRIVKKPFYTQDLLDVFAYYNFPMLSSYFARYLPRKNVIDISPGILQGFFFNPDRANYINYGRTGSIIGHEMGHAFDTSNRRFDKNGFDNNWWSNGTNEAYLDKAKCFTEQYNYAAEKLGVKVNGSKSVDENIADNIGVKLSYLMYQDDLKQNGSDSVVPELGEFSNNQLFWLSYASQWCSAPQRSAGNSKHLSANLRVVGTVANIPEFSKDFNCPAGSNMNPRDKCNLF